jgi:hypothetical protein
VGRNKRKEENLKGVSLLKRAYLSIPLMLNNWLLGPPEASWPLYKCVDFRAQMLPSFNYTPYSTAEEPFQDL